MTTKDKPKAQMQQLQRSHTVEDLPQRLEAWFIKKMTHAKNVKLISLNRTSEEAGMSAEIFIVTVTWQEIASNKNRQEKMVVRAEFNAPTNAASNSNYMISALKLLSSKTDLPIPKLFWAEHDRSILGGPFCVMEFLDGIIAPDSPPFTMDSWVCKGTQQQIEKMYRSGIAFLTKLHQVDWEEIGLSFLVSNTQGITHTESHINEAIQIYDQATNGRHGEFEQTTIKWLKDNLPEKENLRISWSDSRPGNMLWNDFEFVGALDWEMVTLLDPAYDVALWLYADYSFAEGIGVKRLPGMMERDDFIATYEKIAGATLDNYNYFEVLCAFRSHAVVANMVTTWEKNGQHFFGEGITIENSPTAKTFREIASRHI